MDVQKIEAIARTLPENGFSFTADGHGLLDILELADVDFKECTPTERVAYLAGYLRILDRKFGWETKKRLGESAWAAQMREDTLYRMLATLYVLQSTGVLVR